MTLVQWIYEKIGYAPPAPDRADRAIELMNEVIDKSRSLRQQLEPFALEEDPFTSIVLKKQMAVGYENVVEFDRTPRAAP